MRSQIHGMVHCSGGAQTKIMHFVEKMRVVKNNLFPVPPLFNIIQEQSGTNWHEMYKVLNKGGTGSGKTTVVRKIIESLPAGQTAVIPQDSYYWDSSHIPVEERQNINFDEPAAIDFNLLVKHLKELKAGHSIEQPIYSFLTCTRSNETITVEPRDIVIVEGILILCNEELRNMMDMKVFVDADADDRLIRVINRDIIERGRTVEMVIERYERVLKPMHLQHIEPTKRYADIIIPQGGHNSVAIEIMTNFISHKLKG